VKVVEAQPVLGQHIEGRRANGTAERARTTEADVVDQHDHDIRRSLGRLDLEARRRLRIACVEFFISLWLGLRDRQHCAIERLLRRKRRAGDAQRGDDEHRQM
jgi:hypothetical protein